jgi:periplasmic protein TonB
MPEKRFLLSFCAPAVGISLICSATLVFFFTPSMGDFSIVEAEPPELPEGNPGKFSIHPKSISTSQDRADVIAPTAFPSQPDNQDYVASIPKQLPSHEPPNEAVEPMLSVLEAAPVSSKDAPSILGAVSQTQLAGTLSKTVPSDTKSPGKIASLVRGEHPSASFSKGTNRRGSVAAYGAMIRALLMRQPRAVGPAGTATITFAINERGMLRYSRISDSSNNSALDEMALTTVQNAAPFPPPPKALNAEALSYSIQIGFRER